MITNLSLPNLGAITNAYDSVARLTGTWLKNSGGTILNSHTYGYNSNGQRSYTTNKAGNFWAFTYDGAGELKTGNGTEAGGTSRIQEQLATGMIGRAT